MGNIDYLTKLSLLIIIFLIIIEYINTNQSCFRDNRFCFNGEKTEEYQKCIKWSLSPVYRTIKIFENTTLCSRIGRTRFFCPTSKYFSTIDKMILNWDNCLPVTSSCEITDNICENMINWQIFDKSINLNISYKFDIVIILNKSHSQCAISIRSDQFYQINEIKEMFSGCQLLNIYQNKYDLITFNNLNENTKYLFYILPIKHGKLEGSVFNLSLTTDFSIIKNISIKYFSHLSRILEWQYYKDNVNVKYLVTLFKKGSLKSIFTTETTNPLVFLNNLLPNNFYTVNIQTNNSDKFRNISTNYHFNTVLIPSTVLTIQIINKTTTSLYLKWKSVNQTEQNGYADYYLINITGSTNKVFDSINTYISINQLLPCKQYCFTIIAFNVAGQSNNSEIICGVTNAKFDEVNNISIKYQSSFSRIVEWKYDNKHNCNITFHVNLYRGGIKYELITTKTKNTSILLTNLFENQFYLINIRLISGNQYSTSSIDHQFHTMKLPSIPKEIEIFNIQTNSLEIKWKKSIQTNEFGYAEGYQINIYGDDIFNRIYDTIQTKILINKLFPCRKYCLTISAFNKAGKSSPSRNICTNTKLGEFDRVILKEINYKTIPISIHWNYENKLKCENVYFKIIYFPKINFHSITSIKTKNENISLDNLQLNKIYLVKVRPEWNEEIGKFSDDEEIFIRKDAVITNENKKEENNLIGKQFIKSKFSIHENKEKQKKKNRMEKLRIIKVFENRMMLSMKSFIKSIEEL